jgi:hypothetical protein
MGDRDNVVSLGGQSEVGMTIDLLLLPDDDDVNVKMGPA